MLRDVTVITRIGITCIGRCVLIIWIHKDGKKEYRWDSPKWSASGTVTKNDYRLQARLDLIRLAEPYLLSIVKYNSKGKKIFEQVS